MKYVKSSGNTDDKQTFFNHDYFDLFLLRFSVEFINIPCMTEQKGHCGMRIISGVTTH